MILHHPPADDSLTLTREWVVDTQSLSLARITLTDEMRVNVEAFRPIDHDAPFVSESLEPFSPTTLAARILRNLRERVHPEIKIGAVTMLDQRLEDIPEYADFYELDGDRISIMRTCDPVFIADFDGEDWLIPDAFRNRNNLDPEVWADFFIEAYEALLTLNALPSRR